MGSVCLFVFEAGSHCIALAGTESKEMLCLCLVSARIKPVCHHAWSIRGVINVLPKPIFVY